MAVANAGADSARTLEAQLQVSKGAPSMDEAIQEVGIGRTQWTLLILCGLTFCSDAAEVTFLSYVTEVLQCEWGITEQEETYITSAVFVGMILGAPVWGFIADNMGRRPSFLVSSAVITSFGFLTALCQDFTQLLICRAVVGFGVAGLPVGFDILAEALPAEGRGKFLLYIEYFWTLGSIYVNCCAWATLESAGWRVFTALAAVPTLVASIAGYICLPESPRWLISQGKSTDAVAIINQWAKRNGHKHMQFASLKAEKAEEDGDHLKALCTKRKLRTPLLLMAVVWFAFGVAYYGIVMLLPRIFESKSQVGGCQVEFEFTDLAIASAAEVLGVIIAICIIDNPGRAFCQGIFYALGSAAALALGFRSLGATALTIIASIGRLAEMAASCATWVHTPELFPTQVRAEVHGLLNLVSKVGAVFAPFLISDAFTQWECGVIMASISLLAALCAFCLPETAGKDLSEMEDAGSTTEGEDEEDESGDFDGEDD